MEWKQEVKRVMTWLILSVCLAGCTLSFSNISTHGTATDLVDENQAASPTVSPVIDVPKLPM